MVNNNVQWLIAVNSWPLSLRSSELCSSPGWAYFQFLADVSADLGDASSKLWQVLQEVPHPATEKEKNNKMMNKSPSEPVNQQHMTEMAAGTYVAYVSRNETIPKQLQWYSPIPFTSPLTQTSVDTVSIDIHFFFVTFDFVMVTWQYNIKYSPICGALLEAFTPLQLAPA